MMTIDGLDAAISTIDDHNLRLAGPINIQLEPADTPEMVDRLLAAGFEPHQYTQFVDDKLVAQDGYGSLRCDYGKVHMWSACYWEMLEYAHGAPGRS
jgi:hypothetical protein